MKKSHPLIAILIPCYTITIKSSNLRVIVILQGQHNKKDYNKTDNAEMSKNAANNLIFYTSSAK